MKWMDLVTGGLIILICLMPVAPLWGLTIPLLLLLLIGARVRGKGGGLGLWGWEFGLVGLIFGISAAISTGFKPGFNGFRPQMLLETESWILMACLVSRAITRELGQKILKYLVLSSLIWMLLGLRQLVVGVPTNPSWLSGAQSKLIPVRIYSVFINPNIYALYLIGVFVLALEFAARNLNSWCKAMYGMIAGLAILSLYFTYSRMAWILAGVYGFGRVIRRFKWRGLLITMVVILVLLTLPAFRIRLSGLISLSDSSLLYRIRIWRGTLRALGDHWLWGAGPGSFDAVYPLYQIGNTPAQHAHQLYLQIGLEYGIFALGGFIFLVTRLVWNHDFPGLRAILLIFLGYGFSETWYLSHYIGGFFWLTAGLLGTVPVGGQSIPDNPPSKWRLI